MQTEAIRVPCCQRPQTLEHVSCLSLENGNITKTPYNLHIPRPLILHPSVVQKLYHSPRGEVSQGREKKGNSIIFYNGRKFQNSARYDGGAGVVREGPKLRDVVFCKAPIQGSTLHHWCQVYIISEISWFLARKSTTRNRVGAEIKRNQRPVTIINPLYRSCRPHIKIIVI